MRSFKAPKEALGNLDAEATAGLIAAVSDLTLSLDADGVIRDLAATSEDLPARWFQRLLGRPWIETVTVESRPKVEALLQDALARAGTRWRHVNHPALEGADIPIMYAAVKLGDDGRVVAIGRDLRSMAALQQRIVDAQQSLERDYAKLRHAETRYRLLFQFTSEAVLIVDAASQRIVEINPAAGELLGLSQKEAAGRPFLASFQPDGAASVQMLLAGAQTGARSEPIRAGLAGGQRELTVAARLFRQEGVSLYFVRLIAAGDAASSTMTAQRRVGELLRAVEGAPDGFVAADPEGRLVAANAAFLDLIQIASEEQVMGESLERWLGRPGVDLNVLTANLRQHRAVRLFATTLRGEYGAVAEIELSAVALAGGEQPRLGFVIRDVGRRPAPAEQHPGRNLPRSVEHLTELVGRVPLKELVRETTDVIERLCIEAALELTGDNRASAAEILGLSRQSLYVKLRRYGLGDLASEDEA